MLKEQTKRPIITIKREQTLEMSQNSYLVQVVKKVNEKKTLAKRHLIICKQVWQIEDPDLKLVQFLIRKLFPCL